MFTMQVAKLFNKANDFNVITLDVTVDRGFELIAERECKETFGDGCEVILGRGRVCFNIPVQDYFKVRKMRSIDNVFLVTAVISDLPISDDKDSDLKTLKEHANKLMLDKLLPIWMNIMNFTGILFPTQEYKEKNNKKLKKGDSASTVESTVNLKDQILKFRVTCNRSGDHCFSSMEAAHAFGGQLNDRFHWTVDLVSFDIKIMLNIIQNQAYVTLALTKESLHRRNIVHFRSTTLRATICYNLLRLADPELGDIIVDPMCGGASISIEGALSLPYTFQLCGDISWKAVYCTGNNLANFSSTKQTPLPVDALQWDATRLPVRTASIDIIVTDLGAAVSDSVDELLLVLLFNVLLQPFGKRCGIKKNNNTLYTRVLMELTRVVRLKGRASLLTQDKRTLLHVLDGISKYWIRKQILDVNIGGLNGAAFYLERTPAVWPAS